MARPGTFRAASFVPLILALLLSALTAADKVPSKSRLEKAIAEEKIDEVKSLVSQLAATGDVKSARVILDVALKSRVEIEPDFFEVLLKGLASLATPPCIELYEKELNGSLIPARVLIVDAASHMSGDAGISLILTGLRDDTTMVTEAALAAVLKRMPKGAIPVLIGLLEDWSKRKVKDAVFYNIKETLIQLTGESLTSPEDWRKWWAVNEASFDPKAIKEGKRTARRPVLGSDDDPQFFGVPISSKNAVFVIDTSDSMRLVQKDDIPGLTGVRGVDQTEVVEKPKEPLTPENKRLAEYWTRIEMAKRHLSKVLENLRPPTKFNIYGYNDRVIGFGKKSAQVSRTAQKKGLQWVKGLRPTGNTHTLAAIEEAFKSDPGLNTIYFLSDGLPSKDGKTEDDRDKILKEVLKMNRFRKIKIHTFGFYPFSMAGLPSEQLGRANEFLKQMAQKTGGTFTEMKVDPNEKPPPDFKGEPM